MHCHQRRHAGRYQHRPTKRELKPESGENVPSKNWIQSLFSLFDTCMGKAGSEESASNETFNARKIRDFKTSHSSIVRKGLVRLDQETDKSDNKTHESDNQNDESDNQKDEIGKQDDEIDKQNDDSENQSSPGLDAPAAGKTVQELSVKTTRWSRQKKKKVKFFELAQVSKSCMSYELSYGRGGGYFNHFAQRRSRFETGIRHLFLFFAFVALS